MNNEHFQTLKWKLKLLFVGKFHISIVCLTLMCHTLGFFLLFFSVCHSINNMLKPKSFFCVCVTDIHQNFIISMACVICWVSCIRIKICMKPKCDFIVMHVVSWELFPGKHAQILQTFHGKIPCTKRLVSLVCRIPWMFYWFSKEDHHHNPITIRVLDDFSKLHQGAHSSNYP